MASQEVGKIIVSVEHRQDKLDRGLDKAESRVRQSVDKMNKDTEKGLGGGFVNAFAKGLAALGAFEAGLKGLTAITQAMDGDLEGVEQTVRSLPLGLGPVIGAAIDLAKAFGQSRKEAEAIQKATEGIEKSLSRQEQLRRGKTIRNIDDPGDREIQAEAFALQDREKQIKEERENIRQELRDLGAKVKGGVISKEGFRLGKTQEFTPGQQLKIEELRQQDKLLVAEQNDVTDKINKIRQKQADEQAKIAEQEVQKAKEAARQKLEAEVRTQQTLASIRAQELELSGQLYEAQIAQINAKYDAQLALEEDAGDRVLIERMRQLEVERARRADIEKKMADQRQREENRQRNTKAGEAEAKAQDRVGQEISIARSRIFRDQIGGQVGAAPAVKQKQEVVGIDQMIKELGAIRTALLRGIPAVAQ